MRPRLARALLVLTVFALLAALAVTPLYIVALTAKPPAPPNPWAFRITPPLATVFLAYIRYYLAWALVAPIILWLARRVPLRGRRWPLALAFHVAVPVAGSVPLLFLRILLANVQGLLLDGAWKGVGWPGPQWLLAFAMHAIHVLPIYWLLLALGFILQSSREHAANELRTIELERSLADAQLDALKMKLQPHFLFNTLNAITSLARAGETDAVMRLVERLGTLLRLSMETSGRQVVTLEEELALVDAYLAIEEIRFRDQLRVIRRVSPEACSALVPNLILQPLVENALVHGLSRRLDAGLLEIVVSRDGERLRIAVRDDGPGLPARWSLSANAGAGLKNVSDRLRGLYPGACTFRVENGATGGAVALLAIPFADARTTAIAESAIHG